MEGKTIAVMSFKGGVGKTTIANLLGEKVEEKGEKTLILNLDSYQDNESFNTVETVNIDMDQPIKDLLAKSKSSGIFTIIDAGGFDDSRLYDLDIDLFIFVTRTDLRSIQTTADTAATVLEKSTSSTKRALFVINQYENEKELEVAGEALKEILSISEIEADDLYMVGLKKSNAITTAINRRKKLSELFAENRAAYKKVNEEFKEFADEVMGIILKGGEE